MCERINEFKGSGAKAHMSMAELRTAKPNMELYHVNGGCALRGKNYSNHSGVGNEMYGIRQ
jgi:hypothetical protein